MMSYSNREKQNVATNVKTDLSDKSIKSLTVILMQ